MLETEEDYELAAYELFCNEFLDLLFYYSKKEIIENMSWNNISFLFKLYVSKQCKKRTYNHPTYHNKTNSFDIKDETKIIEAFEKDERSFFGSDSYEAVYDDFFKGERMAYMEEPWFRENMKVRHEHYGTGYAF